MNTSVHYLYRDAANYKKGNTVIVAGEITFEQIEGFLDGGEYFIAGDVGLEDIQLEWEREGYKFPNDDDHVFCEIHEDDFSPTQAEPTVAITAAELLANFQRLDGKWDVSAAMKRMGLK